MAAKKGAKAAPHSAPQAAAGGALPAHFDPEKTYLVRVTQAFQVSKLTIRPGLAHLRGDIAQANRDKLQPV